MIEKINSTPVSDLFHKLKGVKDAKKRSTILNKIIDRIYKGMSKLDRQTLWSEICNLKKKTEDGEYQKLLLKPCPDMKVILQDVERTFCEFKQFEAGSKGQTDLINVLHAISVYKEDISYVQGMNFIAASLLCTFNAEESFWVFQTLINEYKLYKMYTDNMPLLQLFSYQLRTL